MSPITPNSSIVLVGSYLFRKDKNNHIVLVALDGTGAAADPNRIVDELGQNIVDESGQNITS